MRTEAPAGTPITDDELARIGRRLVALVGTSAAMGHVSPAGTTMYVAPDPDDWTSQLVVDAFGACLVGEHGDAHRERLAHFVEHSDVLDRIAEAVTR